MAGRETGILVSGKDPFECDRYNSPASPRPQRKMRAERAKLVWGRCEGAQQPDWRVELKRQLRRRGGQRRDLQGQEVWFLNFKLFARLRKLRALLQLLPTFSKILLQVLLSVRFGGKMKEKAELPPLSSKQPSWILPAPTPGLVSESPLLQVNMETKRHGLWNSEQN